MNIRKMRIAALVLAVCLSCTAQASLQGRDLNGSIDSFEAYYDTDRDITWLADAYAEDGKWTAANTWAANLSFTDGVNTYDNWRLPTTLQPDASCSSQSGGVSQDYNCTGSEMGHLFYVELGGVAGQSIRSNPDPDLAKFTNLSNAGFWSATEYPLLTGYAWYFSFAYGHQAADSEEYANSSHYALAVSPGDVGIAAVPEPETYAMMLAGLGLVGAAARRRQG